MTRWPVLVLSLLIACGSPRHRERVDVSGVGNTSDPCLPLDVLIVLWGQSGAGGNSGTPTLLTPWTADHPGLVWYWLEDSSAYFTGAGSGSATGSTGNAFVTVEQENINGLRAPLHIALSRVLWAKGIPNATVWIASGSTALRTDWNVDTPAGKELAAVLLDEIEAAIAADDFPLVDDFRYVLFVSHIGEADAGHEAGSLAYADNWRDLLHAAEDRFPGKIVVPFVVRLSDASALTYADNIRDQQDALPSQDARIRVFDPSHLTLVDGLHQPAQGHMVEGLSSAEMYRASPHFAIEIRECSSAKSWDRGAGTGPVGSTTMTVAAYARMIGAGPIADEHQLINRRTTGAVDGWALRLGPPVSSGNASVRFSAVNTTPAIETASVDVTLTTDKVHQIAVVRDGTAVQVYLDGSPVGDPETIAATFTPANTAQMRIGRHSSGSADELGILSVAVANDDALTDEQIATAWTAAQASHDYSIPSATHWWHASAAGGTWYDWIAHERLDRTSTPTINFLGEPTY